MCSSHPDVHVKFLCTKEGCYKELCDLCILDHKEHIKTIKSIYEVIDRHCQDLEAKDLKSIKNAIVHREADSFNKLDHFLDEYLTLLKSKFRSLKRRMLFDSSSKSTFIENYPKFK